MFDKFNILIAGPVYDAEWVTKNAEYYMNQGFYVTISTWDGWEADKLKIPHVKSSMVHVNGEKIYGFHPGKQEKIESSLYYQCKSVENAFNSGIESTEFCIKLRTDEFYSDLSQIVFELTTNPTHIVTNNVYLRDQKDIPFSISDHVIGMSMENMEKTFRSTCFFFDTFRNLIHTEIFPKGIMNKEGQKINYVRPEQIISKMFLQNSGVITPMNDASAETIMQDYATFVDIKHMGEYFISSTKRDIYFSNIPNINKNLPKVAGNLTKTIKFPRSGKYGISV